MKTFGNYGNYIDIYKPRSRGPSIHHWKTVNKDGQARCEWKTSTGYKGHGSWMENHGSVQAAVKHGNKKWK